MQSIHSKNHIEKISTQMIATTQTGSIIYSTTCPPFIIEKDQNISLKTWMNSKHDLPCDAQISILTPTKENVITQSFHFCLSDNKFEEINLHTIKNINECYVIKIVIILTFKQSVFLPSNAKPTIEIHNLWLEIFFAEKNIGDNNRTLALI